MQWSSLCPNKTETFRSIKDPHRFPPQGRQRDLITARFAFETRNSPDRTQVWFKKGRGFIGSRAPSLWQLSFESKKSFHLKEEGPSLGKNWFSTLTMVSFFHGLDQKKELKKKFSPICEASWREKNPKNLFIS